MMVKEIAQLRLAIETEKTRSEGLRKTNAGWPQDELSM
jgi:hypothetical protein